MKALRRCTPLLAALVLAACGQGGVSPKVEQVEGVVYRRAVSAEGPFGAFGLTASVESGSIVCRRDVDGEPIAYLTFERAGEDHAYGVYGLAGEKNGMPVDLPLSGEPINWSERNETQGLVHLLTLAGLDAPRAERFVEARGTQLFAEGLRVIFVLKSDGRSTVLTVELRT